MTTVGERMMRILSDEGVDAVFGIPGSHNLPLFAGIGAAGLRLVSPKHEQGAAFAADGYARSSGRPGVVIATTGPGILNAATALATSYADSVPVLAISPGAEIADEDDWTGWLHEAKDQHRALDALVDRSIRCRTEEQAYRALRETFATWRIARRRPVHVEVPISLLAAEAQLPEPPRLDFARPGRIDSGLARRIASVLTAAERPVIIAGGGAIDAALLVQELAAAIDAPIATSRAGAGIAGATGVPTTVLPYAPEVLADADAVLVLGSQLARRDIGGVDLASGATVIRVDLDPAELARRPFDLPILADAGAVLRAVLDVLEATAPTGRRERDQERYAAAIGDAYPGPLVGFHRRLAEVLPDDVVITGDSSQVSYLGTGAHHPFDRPRSFLYPDAFAPLGYGLPAAIGASTADPARPVVALIGDGAFMFSVQELSTAVEERIPLVVVVVDNGGYLEIEQEMRAAGIDPFGVRFAYPDFVALAAAFGCRAERVDDVDAIGAAVRSARTDAAPRLVVIRESQLG